MLIDIKKTDWKNQELCEISLNIQTYKVITPDPQYCIQV